MSSHIPVLVNKVIEYLDPKPGRVMVDCTLGTGGHAEELINRLDPDGVLYGIETDERNLLLAKKRLEKHPNINFVHDNFENLDQIGTFIKKKEGHIDGILFDLGLSSLHVDEGSRGFSFQHEGPLDMRFDASKGPTAADIVNNYSLKQLTEIFQTYGEERFSHRIASKILEFRRRSRIETTLELADIVVAAVPKNRNYSKRNKRSFKKVHPATRVFQALRIATNREIEVLQQGLAGAITVLSPGGRLVVISYHSLEDRLVKNLFKQCKADRSLQILTKKPVTASYEEIQINRRSRSAKLRAAVKN